ncbi:Bag family molecular chaperone regulator [Thalictrum thalictroides]|uniref:Bag family molecular chaperone regulator n=1 Tax=Thalictrum thalictroides TaxID=46969 RepID=A0A7J6UUF7_THATH|nr:Bag family molecular chaperone regulator [Thalictrum thalictroides]
MKKDAFNKRSFENKRNEEIGWELRPGGMLVQKRIDGVGASGPIIKIKVSHGSYQHEINVPAQSTFGDLKKLLVSETGLEPKEQRLLFRGKEKEDEDCLHMVGVMDMSKVVLLEDPASRERKLRERKMDNGISKACEAISKVRAEVDKLTKMVSALESTIYNGTKVADKELITLTELFMIQLLKLDSIMAEGEAKAQRRIEVST